MESPLVVKPYVERMTESELMAVMTAGLATISGTVLAAYAGMLLPYHPDAAGHLIAASVMSAPAALVMAKLLVPETSEPITTGSLTEDLERPDVNVIDAAARGAAEGLRLALVVGAMLIAFIALVAMINGLLGWLGAMFGTPGITLEGILGAALAPVAWMLGIPWADAGLIGRMIGVDFVLNEFVAFVQLSNELGAGASSRAPIPGHRDLCIDHVCKLWLGCHDPGRSRGDCTVPKTRPRSTGIQGDGRSAHGFSRDCCSGGNSGLTRTSGSQSRFLPPVWTSMSDSKKRLIVVGDRVLIQPEEGEDRTKVGLYLPPTAVDNQAVQGGTVMATGPGNAVSAPTELDVEPWKIGGAPGEPRYVSSPGAHRGLRDLFSACRGRDHL